MYISIFPLLSLTGISLFHCFGPYSWVPGIAALNNDNQCGLYQPPVDTVRMHATDSTSTRNSISPRWRRGHNLNLPQQIVEIQKLRMGAGIASGRAG